MRQAYSGRGTPVVAEHRNFQPVPKTQIAFKKFYPIYIMINLVVWFIVMPIVRGRQAMTLEDFVTGELVGFAVSFAAFHIAKIVYDKRR
ncbi:MAG: hypothetical protein L0287_06755 [Anaerolineae bacterium]|nr:hypothetical protein [Anaerolineae bacterium]